MSSKALQQWLVGIHSRASPQKAARHRSPPKSVWLSELAVGSVYIVDDGNWLNKIIGKVNIQTGVIVACSLCIQAYNNIAQPRTSSVRTFSFYGLPSLEQVRMSVRQYQDLQPVLVVLVSSGHGAITKQCGANFLNPRNGSPGEFVQQSMPLPLHHSVRNQEQWLSRSHQNIH